jgi:predicted nucleic acid-binding protein
LITSAFTFGEVLAGAYRAGAVRAADESRRLLQRVVSEVVPFSLEVSEHYARIRGTQGIPPGDAIHLACAAQAGTDLFLTNDKRLASKFIHGIQFIATLDTSLL